jgi:Zn-dependent protease with chaperone function
MTSETPDICPNCTSALPAAGKYPPWCTQCEWGLADPEAPGDGFLRAWRDRRSASLAEALYAEVSGAKIGRPGWDAARVVSYLLALCVHACTLGLFGLACWLVWTRPNIVTVIIAVVLALVALFVAPRLGRIRDRGDVRRRADAPALFGLLDRVGSEVGARPVDAVVVSGAFNASYGTAGLRRRRVLELGLPLWDTLPAQQRVALIGHELAHGVNGDSRHGLIVGTSLSTLSRLYHATLPGGPDRRMNYLVDLMARTLQRALSSVIFAVLTIQHAITMRAGQRAEYLADDLAARVTSPATVADTLDTMLTTVDSHAVAVRRHALNTGGEFWNDRREALAGLPEPERERRRRLAARQRVCVDDSHPPTHLRIAALRGRPDAEPRVRLEADEEQRIQAELAPDYARIAKELRESARAALYR